MSEHEQQQSGEETEEREEALGDLEVKEGDAESVKGGLRDEGPEERR